MRSQKVLVTTVALLVATISISPATFAASTSSSPTPSASPTSSSTTSSSPTATPSSTPSSKAQQSSKNSASTERAAALASARDAYLMTTNSALQGFDRAVADAKAVRDQALMSAGTDKAARKIAIENYKNQYNQIYQAFNAQILAAKQTFAAAKAAIK